MNAKSIFHLFWMPLLIAGFITGCGSSGNTTGNGIPDWVENPGNSFSQDKYLMAVGSGSTLKEARSDAFSSLSQIFKMNINATEVLKSETIDQFVNGEMFSEGTSQLLNNIRIGTNQELMNTTILVSEVDGYGTYHALAGMDRAESSRIYRQEISNNSLKINEYEQSADSENNLLQKLLLLKKAKTIAGVNEVLTQQLNIILGGAASGGEATNTLNRIEQKFRATQQLANVTIITKNAPEMVKSAIAGVFQKAGFNIADNTDNAILTVDVVYQAQPANLNRNDAEFVKWELMIEVIDQQSNRSFKTFTTEGRDGAPSYEDALKRAGFTARSKIENDFNIFLNSELLANF
ncbi:MAG: LPP20 family lipoprotein [Balneolaceae bacterium]